MTRLRENEPTGHKDSGSMLGLRIPTLTSAQDSSGHGGAGGAGGSIFRGRRAISRWLYGMNSQVVCISRTGMAGERQFLVTLLGIVYPSLRSSRIIYILVT